MFISKYIAVLARQQITCEKGRSALLRLDASGRHGYSWPMPVHRRWLLRASVATMLIASLASWHPAMMASMATMPQDAAHPAHMPGGSHHQPAPLQCCDLCSLTCAGAAQILVAVPSIALQEQVQDAPPIADGETSLPSAWPHRLPFPVGPPTLRLA
jgi:hypothetical protein